MEYENKILEDAVMELRRGILVLGVLSQLDVPRYGYSLIQLLDQKGMAIDQNTLYPLLRRLEKQGFLKSDWSVEESRPRKYYAISGSGTEFLGDLAGEWEKSVGIMKTLLGKK
ncbi:MAG: PadR family transcriptional regulator [Clostridia bacterium]